MAPETASLQLPMQVTSPVDVGRLLRELESIDAALTQAGLRGEDLAAKMPKATTLMDQTVQLNKLNLADIGHRQQLANFLKAVKTKGPLLHISFSADPSTTFTEKLLTYLRNEIHPNVLLTIGLQPNIAAGCIVRSTNKYFDFSLRQEFINKRGLLIQKIDEAMKQPIEAAPTVNPDFVPLAPLAAVPKVAA
jgi:hypothetical protein